MEKPTIEIINEIYDAIRNAIGVAVKLNWSSSTLLSGLSVDAATTHTVTDGEQTAQNVEDVTEVTLLVKLTGGNTEVDDDVDFAMIFGDGTDWMTETKVSFSIPMNGTTAVIDEIYAVVGAMSKIKALTVKNNQATPAAWAASTSYSVDDVRIPTTPNDHIYVVTVAGTSGDSEPTWPTDGSTVVDGSVTWKDAGTLDVTINYIKVLKKS